MSEPKVTLPLGWQSFCETVKAIDEAFRAIDQATRLPDEAAYEQKRITMHVDNYGRPVSDEAKVRARVALDSAIAQARALGEQQRDAIIAANVAYIDGCRAYLNQCCGAAVIDLGSIARAALSDSRAES